MRLNVKLGANSQADALKKASAAKAGANETMDEAWMRIFAQKNSESDLRKLQAVKAAFEAGKIGREPVAKGKKTKRFSKAEALRLYKIVVENQRKETLQEMVDHTPENYWLITDKAKLAEFTEILSKESEIVFDVETTGTDVWSDYIVGHVITAISADIHAYIPTRHKTESPQLDNAYVVEVLRPFYENEAIGKLAHNAKFDIHMLDREGVDLRGLTWDTQEAMRLLNENEQSFALKTLVTKYLGIPSLTYGELFGNIGFDEVSDLRVALAYAAKDGDITRKLCDFQREYMAKMPEVLKYYEAVEVPLIKTLVHIESTGYLIDQDFAKEYGKELKADIDALHAELINALGNINVDSPAQLKPALSEAIGEKLSSTDAKKVLKPLSHKHPIIKTLLEYKGKMKMYSTYINVLPELVDKKTGLLHANFNGNGAKTGRMSSGGDGDEESFGGASKDGTVNLQNQPKGARKLFIAPPGYAIVGADWSQQEYRCLAYLTQEPLLLEAYESGKDLYSTMASRIFGVPYEECGDGTDYRKKAKVGLLATVYGTSKYTLALQLGVSVDDADKFLKDLFASMPVVSAWIKENEKYAKKHGYVWMDKKQRKRRLPEATLKRTFIPYGKYNDPNYAEAKKRNSSINRAMRQATNAIVQGSSAIQTKVSMNAIYRWCEEKRKQGRDFRMWCVVHDESLILVPDDITREEIREYERLMLESYPFGNVKLKTDIEIMRRWGEGVTIDDWFSAKAFKTKGER